MDKKKVINATGWDCPLPLLALKKELPSFCEEAGHDVLTYEKLGASGWRIVVKK